MTEQQMNMIKNMSNEDLVLTYKQYVIMNDKELNIIGIKAELQKAMFNEIMRRMK